MIYRICIVIPCYNEEKNFLIEKYISFIEKNKDVHICFVNDGATDNTLQVLNNIKVTAPEQITVLSNEKNLGKAESVRNGMQYINDNVNSKFCAYLDSDLATSLEECSSLTEYLTHDIEFCFGSRILKVGSNIERKKFRFITGRFVATLISIVLSIKVYDTQCGCKLFTKDLSSELFKTPFISKWLFDVELFFRFFDFAGREKAISSMKEIPLNEWIDRGDSKVKVTYFPFIFRDLIKIKQKYRDL